MKKKKKKGVLERLEKKLLKPVKSRRILRKEKTPTVVIRTTPSPYVRRFFKEEYERDKKSFLKS